MHATTQSAPRRLAQREFIAMSAMMFATIAFSIDAMLPALPVIGAELTPDSPNQAAFIITAFVLGMGIGTFFVGPLSDAFGRRRVILAGGALYLLGALFAWAADQLEMVLLARLLQGLGAAAPRVVGLAVVRDLYSGREMAKITSFVMMIFTLLPALAPTIGAVVISMGGWRAIFIVFMLFASLSIGWYMLRQPETLPPNLRRPIRADTMIAAMREVFSNRMVVLSIAVQALVFSVLFMVLSSTQQVFAQYFGRGETFHIWFGVIALCAGTASIANARLVVRLGMRYLISIALTVEMILAVIMVVLLWTGVLPAGVEFAAYVLWSIALFGLMGLTVGNLNALAMEPMGHIAGLAASIIGAVATVISVVLAAPVGLAFNGTPVPMAIGITLAILAARGLFLLMPRD
jgi:MFS transporter, DHA1 family, multidrug resistance protein